MTESVATAPTLTAGQLLRRAREARNMHIAALAAALKVPQRKLEALERDALDELPDVAFARALAKAACRVLKTDPTPVLALLPKPDTLGLDQVGGGLNTPFRESGQGFDASVSGVLQQPAFWVVSALALAALGVYFWPVSQAPEALPAAVAPALVASAPEAAAASALPLAASDPVPVAEPAASAAAPEPAPLLRLRSATRSWIDVTDGAGRKLLSRVVLAQEEVDLDGEPPLRLVIGNAAATEVALRGVAVDLAEHTRDNVARLELK